MRNALADLSAEHDQNRLFSLVCDVTIPSHLQRLWDESQERFGQIDIWINNAGIGHPLMDFREHSPEEIGTVVSTNLLGAMYGSRVALNGMLQQGFGGLYNMEGHGSTGRKQKGLTLYGSTKYGLRYLNESLAAECKGTSVLVGALAPGMVVTDLLTGQFENRPEEWERAKRVFNVLADRVETVAPWMAQRVLENDKNGVRIAWYSRGKLAGRFLTAPFRDRNVIE